jgi:hypothetical protein
MLQTTRKAMASREVMMTRMKPSKNLLRNREQVIRKDSKAQHPLLQLTSTPELRHLVTARQHLLELGWQQCEVEGREGTRDVNEMPPDAYARLKTRSQIMISIQTQHWLGPKPQW